MSPRFESPGRTVAQFEIDVDCSNLVFVANEIQNKEALNVEMLRV
jgi:hypothetical protein